MRSYHQKCGIAKALDVVGDRWTLLIVRELLIQRGCRYTDLKTGLPGIASNLLVERLQELEAAGVVVRQEEPPPIATTLYYLTERGRELEPALQLLGAWGVPLLHTAPKTDTMSARWIVLPLRQRFAGKVAAGARTCLELRVHKTSIVIEDRHGFVDVRLGVADRPDATLVGDANTLLAMFLGKLSRAAAQREGIAISGNQKVLDRFLRRKKEGGNAGRAALLNADSCCAPPSVD